jgi:hypothetical protein
MLTIISSRSLERSDLMIEQPRKPGEDNLAWLRRTLEGDSPAEAAAPRKRATKKVRAPKHTSAQTARAGGDAIRGSTHAGSTIELVLLGGTSPTDFRLRVAQAHARHDLSPSLWSHVAMLDARAAQLGETRIFEVSLVPEHGFGFPPPENGVQESRLARYASPEAFPNIAQLSLPVDRGAVMTALADLCKQRAALDVPALVLAWLAFTWGVGGTGNPLLAGQGIPSAAVLERVIGAAQFDLTPGVVERATCPEAIWQAALWWQTYYTDLGREAPRGKYCANHRLDGR